MRACPFCSGEEITLVNTVITKPRTYLGTAHEVKTANRMVYYQCDHCCAEGSHFVGPHNERDDLEESALEAWNGDHR